ncbi:MAG: GldM family protein [Ferruginibacter sp.]
MKHVLLFSLLSVGILPINSQFANVADKMISPDYSTKIENNLEGFNISSQSPGNEKMLAIIFKAQEYCRVELKDFEFNAPFRLVSATVYFSGTNFKNVEKGVLTSTSLKPIKSLMDRCAAGSMIVFDNVKVMGPDDFLRTIPGTSYLLH